MSGSLTAFSFEYVPLDYDKTSISVFQHSSSIFSLEYSIFKPKTVKIDMYTVKGGWLRKKNHERGLAVIKQFASALGLHPDLFKIHSPSIHIVLEMLQSRMTMEGLSSGFHAGGILATPKHHHVGAVAAGSFSDDLLEVLTDNPQFAIAQLVFRSIEVPKEFQPTESNLQLPQLRFDLHRGRVERRINPIKANVMTEVGCYEFSPRVLIVETDRQTLQSKLSRLSVLFESKGFRTTTYPKGFKRFKALKRMILKRKLVTPIILDGYSLMGFISLPHHQYSHNGYSLVPHKIEYDLSAGLNTPSSKFVIDLGVPITSGRTANNPLLLGGNDLNRHMAVFGMTGEGKSRFIYGVIKEFYRQKVKFLIFDPKGEYIQPVKSFCDDFVYIKPGSSTFPWGINIFQIPKDNRGEDLIPMEDHVLFVVSVLEHIFEDSDNVSPQMRRVLHQAVIETVKHRGDFKHFVSLVQSPKDLGIQGTYLENTSAGIINRIEKLFFGNTGRCFTVRETTFEIGDLLERNSIIDLSGFEAMEDQLGRRIFLEVVFQFLYYFIRMSRLPYKEDSLPKNVIVLDETQKLIPTKNHRVQSPTSMIGRGPWTLRAYDVSMIFVGTDPIIDQAILTNTGILAIFFTNYDSYAISNLLGLSKTDYEQLRNLLKVKPTGRRCILSVNGKVTLLQTNNFTFEVQQSHVLNSLKNAPFYTRLRKKYQELWFNPLER
ncbi:MAG: ATP-binding protein [Candidatus Heimdallarchaeota archaeon]